MRDRKASQGVLWGRLTWHPAVKAWLAFADGAAEPDSIEVLRDDKQSAAYRLVGAGPGGESVIARRTRALRTVLERTLYERILPHLPVAARRYVGCRREAGECVWLFFRDSGPRARP